MNRIKFASFSTSKKELIDLLKAWIAISLAFAIVRTGFTISPVFFQGIILSAITVGIGFLLHELAHKIVAQRYGCFAEFRSSDNMLLLAVASSFLGVVFAAPGAVMIAGHITRRENGLIAVAGPITNIVLALCFHYLPFFLPQLKLVSVYGFQINAWLALFNMLPFFILDGKKVWKWNQTVWIVVMGIALGLVFLV